MKKEKRSNAVFYGLMGIMLGLFVISLIATGGEMYLSAADLCHLYDLQQISANGYGKKTRNVCRA